jgi:hypothetical protein
MQHDPHQQHHTEPGAAHSTHGVASHGLTTLVVPTGRIPCRECRGTVEQQLKANPHVAGVYLDPEHEVAHVQVHEGMVTSQELAELIAGACGERNQVPLPKPEVSSHAHAHATGVPKAAVDHAAMGHGGHGVPAREAAMGHGSHGAHDM